MPKRRNTLENYHEVKRFEELNRKFQERKMKEIFVFLIFAAIFLPVLTIWCLVEDSKPDGRVSLFEIRYEETGENNCFIVMSEHEYLLIGAGDEAHEEQLNAFAATTAAKNFRYFLLPEESDADIEHLFFYRNFKVENIILPWSLTAETPTDYIGQTFSEAGESSLLRYDSQASYPLGKAEFAVEKSDSGIAVRVSYLDCEFLIVGNKIEVLKGDVPEKYRVIDTDEKTNLVIKFDDYNELEIEKERKK